ncbi:hypothetical protein Hdeb2414_s0010g00354731 [Helianthus debilis subsp. tardiflorus]
MTLLKSINIFRNHFHEHVVDREQCVASKQNPIVSINRSGDSAFQSVPSFTSFVVIVI